MFTLFHFINEWPVQQVPDQLSIRPNSHVILLLGFGFLGLMFVGLSRMTNLKAVGTVVRVFVNSESIEQAQKENMRLNSLSFILLIMNFLLSFGLVCWLWLSSFHGDRLGEFWVVPFILPLLILLAEFSCIGFVGLISGEQKRIITTVSMSLVGYALCGIVLLALAFVWVLNPAWQNLLFRLILVVLWLFYIVRVIKNSAVVLSNGVPWYYLILYFCTLEILPFCIIYYYVSWNFLQ